MPCHSSTFPCTLQPFSGLSLLLRHHPSATSTSSFLPASASTCPTSHHRQQVEHRTTLRDGALPSCAFTLSYTEAFPALPFSPCSCRQQFACPFFRNLKANHGALRESGPPPCRIPIPSAHPKLSLSPRIWSSRTVSAPKPPF